MYSDRTTLYSSDNIQNSKSLHYPKFEKSQKFESKQKGTAVYNPSVKVRSFAGRKAYDVLVGRIPCMGDPTLVSYQNHKLIKETNATAKQNNIMLRQIFRHLGLEAPANVPAPANIPVLGLELDLAPAPPAPPPSPKDAYTFQPSSPPHIKLEEEEYVAPAWISAPKRRKLSKRTRVILFH